MTFPSDMPIAETFDLQEDTASVQPNAAGGLSESVSGPVISGDPKDDDAAYLDEMLDETPGVDIRTMPPLVHGDEWAHADLVDLPPISNLITQRWSLDSNAQPVRLFPADPYRTELFVRVEGTVIQPLILAGSRTDAMRQGSNAAVWQSLDAFYSVTHTGEVWIYGPAFTVATLVSGWAVSAAPKETQK